MPNYVVNRQAQSNGDHEVHNADSCAFLPGTHNRVSLGFHSDCSSAVAAAKKLGYRANGCYFCAYACHTG